MLCAQDYDETFPRVLSAATCAPGGCKTNLKSRTQTDSGTTADLRLPVNQECADLPLPQHLME